MRMDHFEQGLKGRIEKIVVGHAYASFQEMFQRAMKIARVMDETEVESREMGQPKRKFSPGESNSQGSSNFKRFNPQKTKDKESNLHSGKREGHVTNAGANIQGHIEEL